VFGPCVVAAALLVAGCSSGGGKSSTPTTTSAHLKVAAAACTTPDMARTGFVPMPHPTVLVHARSYESGQARLAPPPADSRPSVSASVVWGASAAPKSPVGTYELVLASYSSPVPSDRGVPDFQHVLSWVVIGHHVPFVGGSATGTSPNAIPHRPCFFATVLEPFNATTGKEMVLAEGTL